VLAFPVFAAHFSFFTSGRSDPQTWAPKPVPGELDEVTIGSSKYVVLDVETPLLGTVVVGGRLEFLGKLDLLLGSRQD